MTFDLLKYAAQIGAPDARPDELFAKILARNDDSGRHGVVIPTESYDFFPALHVPDPRKNATVLFQAKDAKLNQPKTIAWKYYERYPERRLTRLNSRLDDRDSGRRLLMVFKYTAPNSDPVYVLDSLLEHVDPDFSAILSEIFGAERADAQSGFIQRSINSTAKFDDPLRDLLEKFDEIRAMGFVPSLRTGPTGLGYTFETLMGIEENNDQTADYRGIEIKCKLRKETGSGGKINLFQLGPAWIDGRKNIDRLRLIGSPDLNGLYRCYSQVTTTPNNRDLRLAPRPDRDIDLFHENEALGRWAADRLAQRLLEKHSRAVFVKADKRLTKGTIKYHYNELVYCEQPEIKRFLAMVQGKSIVFEFLLSEKLGGVVRNRGYPWRLCDEKRLDELFTIRTSLRDRTSST